MKLPIPRLLKRLVVSVVAITLLLLLTLIAINIPDEDVSPEAQAFGTLPPLPIADEENGYVYQLGFYAPEGQDPQRIGQAHLAWLRSRAESGNKSEALTPPDFDYEHRIRLHGERQDLCRPSAKTSCLESVAKNTSTVRTLLSDNQELLTRYQHFIHFKASVQSLPFLDAADWRGSPVALLGQQLYFAQLLLAWRSGNEQQALHLLHVDMNFWRNNLAYARSFLGKMVATAAVKRDLYLYDDLARSGHLNPSLAKASLESLPAFSDQELDMSLARQAEFVMGNRGFIQKVDSVGGPEHWDTYLMELFFFKPNATVNVYYKAIQLSIKHDRAILSGDGRVAELDPFDEVLGTDLLGLLYNPVGKITVALVMNATEDYATRVKGAAVLLQQVRGDLNRIASQGSAPLGEAS